MIVTPSELLLAIAEHEALEATCTALPGLTREAARSLLRGAAAQLKAPGAGHAPRALERGKLIVYSDGASRGNPGPGGAGAVICDAQGHITERLGKYLGQVTNNVAEYEALLLGLRRAVELGARAVEVRADSELLIRQLQGRYKVKHPAMQELFGKAQTLLARLGTVKFTHVPREKNTDADEMSNRAIDERM